MNHNSYLIKLLLLCLMVTCSVKLHGKHVVGGDVTYEFVSFSQNNTKVTFKVIFNMYRDQFQTLTPYDEPGIFGAYQEQADGSWEFFDSLEAFPQNIQVIEVFDDPCIEENAQVGVESTFYEVFFTLDVIDRDYMIAYQRCCRNLTSTNILNTTVGSVFDVIITSEAQKLGNNSPTFLEYPPIFICSNYPIRENISAIDSEGDELVYSLCAPLQSGGNMGNSSNPCLFPIPEVDGCLPPFLPVDFIPPYSADNPMGGIPAVTLSSNGILSGIPNILGQYVVGICIEEYRNGVLLSKLRRDFQFNVVPCQKAISANLFADSVGVNEGKVTSFINACGNNEVNFESSGIGATVQNFEWLILNPDGSIFFEGKDADLGDLDLAFPELGDYTGYVAVDDGSQCQDTAFFVVSRKRGALTDYEVQQDSCFLGPIVFSNLSSAEQGTNITGIQWNINGEFQTTDETVIYEFPDRGPKEISLISTNNLGCSDTLVSIIDYNPFHDSPMVLSIDTTLCFGDSILFDNRWIKAAGYFEDILTYQSTGCDSVGRSLNLNYAEQETFTNLETSICEGESYTYYDVTYDQTGVFQHSTVSPVTGCDSIIHNLELEVQAYPQITFSESSTIAPSLQDYSIPVSISGSYESIIWQPSLGLSCTDCPAPIVNSDIDTIYTVEVVTEAGCMATATIDINFVFVPDKYYIPTILNHRRQNNEDAFLFLQTSDAALTSVEYDLKVIDRWGSLLFDGKNLLINDKTAGWSTKETLPGVYIYHFTIREFFETKNETGAVTLIK